MSDYDKAREEIITRFLHDIEEYCDGCQVLISGRDPDGRTWGVDCGIGNWHSRLWMASNFVDEHAQCGLRDISMEFGNEETEEGEEE
jgi:hypothetical protein